MSRLIEWIRGADRIEEGKVMVAGNRRVTGLLSALLIVSALLSPVSRAAEASGSMPAAEAARCKALMLEDFASVAEAPAQISAVVPVPAAGALPAFCRVSGYVSPNIGFELQLPLENWNGKFLEFGCGAFCGVIMREACGDSLHRGYACIVSDQGHQGAFWQAAWAYNNLQAQVDFSWRSAHVAAVIGKAITERYYSKQPSRSYFMGCSGGGRQGLVEAQKFPDDFQGIIAGAAAIGFSDVWYYLGANARAAMDEHGQPVFKAGQLERLHALALKKCDMDDGIKDGIIGNPQACKVDPAELSCKAGEHSDDCFNEKQVEAARKLYAGVQGLVTRPRLMPGSELNWSAFFRSPSGAYSHREAEFVDFIRYFGFSPAAGPDWRPEQFDPARDVERLAASQALFSDTNPDLRRFQALGGKIIAYHGWTDDASNGIPSVDYYETVEKLSGGRVQTQNFYRLFMIPGMNHCGGGEGASAIDYLSYLEAWVEKGQAPDKMIGAHVKEKASIDGAEPVTWPLAERRIEFTRPVYPYPMRAMYSGKGDPNRAESFRPVQ